MQSSHHAGTTRQEGRWVGASSVRWPPIWPYSESAARIPRNSLSSRQLSCSTPIMCWVHRQFGGSSSSGCIYWRKTSIKCWLEAPCVHVSSSPRRSDGKTKRIRGQRHTPSSLFVGSSKPRSSGSQTYIEAVSIRPGKPVPRQGRRCWRFYVQSIQRRACHCMPASTATLTCLQR